jgi:DNA-binding NtrC family response regulator
VRELENTIERAVVLGEGPTLGVKDLGLEPHRTATIAIPSETSTDAITLPPDLPLEEAERRYARAVLDREGGNQSAAARALGISRNKLARLLRG